VADGSEASSSTFKAGREFQIGPGYEFIWWLEGLGESDLYHLRLAIQRYFRHCAAQQVGDAFDIRLHVHTLERVGRLVEVIEGVEKERAASAVQQSKWREAERNEKYRAEQARRDQGDSDASKAP